LDAAVENTWVGTQSYRSCKTKKWLTKDWFPTKLDLKEINL